MVSVFSALMAYVVSHFRSQDALRLENMALRHQLAVYQRTVKRPKLRPADRLFWSWLSRMWTGWQHALAFVQPRTVIAWQKKRFRNYWRYLSQSGKPGRPAIAKAVRDLIQDMWRSNPLWGSPRIVGELRKLGINMAKSTVEKYRPKRRKPPSPTWKAFLTNHIKDIVACDFFTVPTASCKVLFVFILLAHERRRIVHFHITEHPTAEWTSHQIVEAFPWESAPRYLLRDRDSIYSAVFQSAGQKPGDRRGEDCPVQPLAKSLLRATHRESPSRRARSYRRAQRTASSAGAHGVYLLLPPLSYPSIPRYGLPPTPRCRAPGSGPGDGPA